MRSNSMGRRSFPVGVALAALALLLPFAQVALANHDDRTLDAEPETASLEINNPHTITATVSSAPTFAGGAVNIDFENEGGVNDNDGDSVASPDRQCTIAAGETSCAVTYTGTNAGNDQWRIWIDHDGINESQGGETEADEEEGRNENANSGGNPGLGGTDCDIALPVTEPDCTDVVQVTWTNTQDPPVPTTLDCDDSSGNDRERERNPSQEGPQSNETYSCSVKDQYGDPDDATVNGENENGVNDPDGTDGASYNTPDYTCDAPAGGSCDITVTQGEAELGTAEICFWIGDGAQGATLCANEGTGPAGEDTGDNLADQVELGWETPVADGLELESEKETLNVGATRTIVADIFDQFGRAFQGNTQVNLEFFRNSPTDATDESSDGNSPGSVDAQCTTTNDTTCTFEYSQTTKAGRDLICGWIGAAPEMKGSSRNASGTCDEEGRVDEDDEEEANESDAPNEGDGIDLVETTFLNDPAATRLECTPEWSRSLTGEVFTLTCKATTDQPNSMVPNTEIDIEFTGAGDGNGNSRQKPDRSCSTGGNGECSITDTSSKAGGTFYTAWLDPDYEDSSVEVDSAEGRREGQKAGDTQEPDNTDVMWHGWLTGKRNVSLSRSANRVNRGSEVDFSGAISAAASACKGGETVKLKSRPSGSGKRYTDRRTTTTSGNGSFNFNNVTVWRDTDFKAIAPKNGACQFAASDKKTVQTT